MTTLDDTLETLKAEFGALEISEFRGQSRILVRAADAFDLLEGLYRRHEFDLLSDITCVDYLNYRGSGDRFGLVYNLLSTRRNVRLLVRIMLNEPHLSIRSVTSLWSGADWLEREVWDMFGICFEGHPDLRRILMPDEFAAFPLRKDYPLQGRGERHNFPTIRRAQA